MYWQNPGYLQLLWLAPLLMGLSLRAERRRRLAARSLLDSPMFERLMPPSGGWRAVVKGALFALGVACLAAAAARPRFGLTSEPAVGRGLDLFVLLDVSRSMAAADAAPSRLERAKSDVRDLLDHLAGDRVGLIVFAGATAVEAPLTTDRDYVRTVLEDIQTDSAPRSGTLIGDAIRKALAMLPSQSDRDRVILLITDGEDHDSFPLRAAQQAADRSVKIFTIGLGDSRQGAPIPLDRENPQRGYVTDDVGRQVRSRMNEQLLEQIAYTTGGAFIAAGGKSYDLGRVYDEHLAQLTRGETIVQRRGRYAEQFQLFLAAGLGLLLCERWLARPPRGARGVLGLPRACHAWAYGRKRGRKRGQEPFVRSTLRAVPAKGSCPLFRRSETPS